MHEAEAEAGESVQDDVGDRTVLRETGGGDRRNVLGLFASSLLMSKSSSEFFSSQVLLFRRLQNESLPAERANRDCGEPSTVSSESSFDRSTFISTGLLVNVLPLSFALLNKL